ncbi:tail fiber protein [Paenibacillus sp. P25]|nr:tail fiber protein [Paenibacillus sp. P25]
MSEAYIGEIRMFSFNFPPKGWALCNGQILPISQNQALFSLLGTTYGGNGTTTFALPDLRGRAPVHVSGNITLGQRAGEETHTLTAGEMPAHTHAVIGSTSPATVANPANQLWAAPTASAYGTTPNASLVPNALKSAGGGQAHNNMQPYLVMNYCICLSGLYPSRP